MDLTTLPSAEIQDGIALQHLWVPMSNSYDALAAEQLRELRIANGMRPYMIVIPPDGQTIAPWDTYRRQFSVPAGSWLIGFATVGGFASSAQRRVSIKDSCTGLPLFSDFIGGGALYTGLECAIGLQALPSPRLIGDPGTIDVELAQLTGGATITYSLVIVFSVPVPTVPVRRYVNPGGIS